MNLGNEAIQKIVSQISVKNEELKKALEELEKIKKELNVSWDEELLKVYSEKSGKFLKICHENEELLKRWVLLMRAEINVN